MMQDMQDMRLDDIVEEMSAHEAKITIHGRSGAAGERPDRGVVVSQSRVGVMEIGECDCV